MIDQVASLTDGSALAMYERLVGQPAVAVVTGTMAGRPASYPGTRMALWPA